MAVLAIFRSLAAFILGKIGVFEIIIITASNIIGIENIVNSIHFMLPTVSNLRCEKNLLPTYLTVRKFFRYI